MRAFGSRATWTSKDYSDLDLAIVGSGPLDRRMLGRLKEAFEDSDLPIRVDVLDWHSISESFRTVIERDYVVVQEGAKPTPSNGWREVTLGECAEFNDSTYSPKEAWPVINYLDTGSISENRISEIQVLESGKDKIPSRARRKVQAGDIVYSTVRPNQKHFGLLKSVPESFLASTGFAVLRGKVGIADTGFLYWFLAQEYIVNYLHSIAENSTSAYPSIRPSDLEHLTLSLPSLPEQRAIAHVLGTLDDKIELNRRTNETLEGMARALFKSWFVDFDPVRAKMDGRWQQGESLPGLPADLYDLFPGQLVPSELGDIPEGWKIKALGELFTRTNARVGDKDVPEYSCTNSGLVPRSEVFKKKLSVSNSKNRLIRKGDFVFGLSRRVLNFGLMKDQVGCVSPVYRTYSVDACAVVTDLLERIMRLRSEYFYLAVSASSREGQSISQDALHGLLVSLPSIAIQQDLYGTVQRLSLRANYLWQESTPLLTLRDTLLPMLVSGEVSARDLESPSNGKTT